MHPLANRYKTERPTWLICFKLPSVTVRLAYPDPSAPPLEVYEGSSVFRFYPGLLTDLGGITHSLLSDGGDIRLEFAMPSHIDAAPTSLSWERGSVEISQWFTGTTWGQRRVIMTGPISGAECGGMDEPVSVSVQTAAEDRGSVIDRSLVVTSDTWPDSEDVPHAEGVDTGITKRAYASLGMPYGEIIGYPSWAVCPIVQDQTDAVAGSTSIGWAKGIVCGGSLADSTSDRAVRVSLTGDRRPIQTTGAGSDILESTTDGDGNAVTLISHLGAVEITSGTTPDAMLMAPPSAYYDDTGPNYYTYIIPNNTTEDEWVVERPEYPGIASNILDAGDALIMDADYGSDDTRWYRVIERAEISYTGDDGSTKTSTNVGGYRLHDDFYSASAGLTDSAWVVQNIAEGAPIFLDCGTYGGRGVPTDPGRVLCNANEVLHTYLSRSRGIAIDLQSILSLTQISGYRIDGQITEADTTPLEWVTTALAPILPVARCFAGNGLRFFHIDPTATDYVADLQLGRPGRDGERVSLRPMQSQEAVINDVTVRYNWQADRQTFASAVFTMRADVDPATQRPSRVLNDRARRSQGLYGLRSITIETRWTSDESTAKKIVNSILDRYHMPRWRVAYRLTQGWGGLDVNDVVKMTDSDIGISGQLARIVEIQHNRQGPTVIVEQMG